MNLAVLGPMFYAAAHTGDLIDTIDVFDDPQSVTSVYVEGTFGLVKTTAESGEWVCHEAVTREGVTRAPRYAVGSSGRLIAWSPELDDGRDGEPVWTSVDGGCNWTALTGLTGQVVSSVTVEGDVVWAATATSGTDNALYRSEAGQPFIASPLVTPDLLLSVRTTSQHVWAVSSNANVLSMWRSTDAGASFETFPVPVPADIDPPLRGTIGALDPNRPGQAWVILDPVGTDRLYHFDSGVFTTLWDTTDNITDLGFDGTTLVAILNDRDAWTVNEDGTQTLIDQPFASGLTQGRSPTWFSYRSFVNDLLAGPSGGTPLTPADVLAPLACESDSTQQAVCVPLWPLLDGRLHPIFVDTGEPPTEPPPTPPTGCGCSTWTSAPLLPVAFIWLTALVSRRRNFLETP